MELTGADIDRYVAAYRSAEPFYPVEQEGIETLPDAFRTGEYGKRDAEWVVRWYFRRYVGAYSHDERRSVEERFAAIDRRTIKDAIGEAAVALDSVAPTTDAGVDDRGGNLAGSAAQGETESIESTQITDPQIVAAMNALERLTELPAVDVAVGSAFLTFLAPERYLPMDERLWAVQGAVSELSGAYPESATIPTYGRFLEAVGPLHRQFDVDARTLYMALWRVWNDLDEYTAHNGW